MTGRLCARAASDPSWWDADADEQRKTFARGVCGRCDWAAKCRADARRYRISGICGGREYVEGRLSTDGPVRDSGWEPAGPVEVTAEAVRLSAQNRWADTAATIELRRAAIA